MKTSIQLQLHSVLSASHRPRNPNDLRKDDRGPALRLPSRLVDQLVRRLRVAEDAGGEFFEGLHVTRRILLVDW